MNTPELSPLSLVSIRAPAWGATAIMQWQVQPA